MSKAEKITAAAVAAIVVALIYPGWLLVRTAGDFFLDAATVAREEAASIRELRLEVEEGSRLSEEALEALRESAQEVEENAEEVLEAVDELTVELEGEYIVMDALDAGESTLLFIDDLPAWDYLIKLDGRDSDDWIGITPDGEVEIHGFEDISEASRAFWVELGNSWPGFVDAAIVSRLDPDGDGLVEFKVDGETFLGRLELLEGRP